MHKRNFLIFFTVLNLIAIAALFIFILHLMFSDAFGTDISRELRVKYIEPVLKKLDISYLFFNLSYSKLPTYDIVISAKNYNELMVARSNKLADLNYKFPYKRAKFIYKGKEYNVEVKLRGLFPLHWMDVKKSWRIRFEKNDLFNGIRRLNLIIPYDRDYLKEAMAYHTASKLGLAVPYNGFAILRLNGRYEGAYFELEQMGKEYLARNREPEDANLYDGEDNYLKRNVFKDMGVWKKLRDQNPSSPDDYSDIYQLQQILQEPDNLFYRRIPHLVNIDKMLRWNVNSMLYFDYHQDNFHNIRLLFSPVTGKFEPLVWDCSHPQYNPDIDRIYNDLVTRILEVPQFMHKRNLIMWNYLKGDKNLNDDLAYFDKLYKQTRFSFLGDSKKNISNLRYLYVMKSIRRSIIDYYNALKSKLQDCLVYGSYHYNLDEPNVAARLELYSGGFSTASLDNIFVSDEAQENINYDIYYDENMNNIYDKSDILLKSSSRGDDGMAIIRNISFKMFPLRKAEANTLMPAPRRYNFFIVADSVEAPTLKTVSIEASNAVTGEKIEGIVKGVDDKNFSRFNSMTLASEEFAKRYPIFEMGEERNRFVIREGEHFIEEDIIVPRYANVTIESGTTLIFADGASLISYGRIMAEGSKGRPILLKAKNKQWGVFGLVGEGADKSRISHLVVRDGSQDLLNGIYFTGALAVHDAEVIITDSLFENNHGDDALNIKKASVWIKACAFKDNDFDGIDIDVASKGSIEDCRFIRNGNDGIDTSYSTITIINNEISKCGDKGISCGEDSRVKILNNAITGCNTGIAVKDKSEALIVNNTITDNSEGISLYNKKPLWQIGGKAQVYNSLLQNRREVTVSGDSDIRIAYCIVSDASLGDEESHVWVGDEADRSRYSGDFKIATEHFKDMGDKVPIGKF